MHYTKMDEWLRKRVNKYDQWLSDEKIAFASKVVPVARALAGKQWVLPTEQVVKFIKDARSFALAPCACRTHYRRCDNPVDICIFLNDISDRLVEKRYARRISLDGLVEKLHQANERGLVHLTLYNPSQYPYAICSCCRCCCHDLQLLLDFDRKDLVAGSDYMAVWDPDFCSNCGICVDRCVFGARDLDNHAVKYHPDKCYGCGLCVTTCPSGAIRMERKNNKSALGS